jgi:hypothetical protein
MSLCWIGLHKWIYSDAYDPESRICLRCGKLQHDYSHLFNGEWRTEEAQRRYQKFMNPRHKTFEDV